MKKMGSELDDFLAQLDEMSTDSASVDMYQFQKQKSENKKLKSLLLSMKDSTKEMLGLYRSERQITIQLQEKLDNANQEYNSLQRRYDEIERNSVNSSFSLNELMNEMKEKHKLEHENYIELSQDYFETLSDATCFFNYEIKKLQNRIISKTERFLRDCLGENFKKPKIIQSKRMKYDETDSNVSKTSSRASKRLQNVNSDSKSKRIKTDIWDMKSVSQASSPAATPHFEETYDLTSEICEAESNFSFSSFSIGNETSFSFLQSQKASSNKKPHCRCHLYPEGLIDLVSIGVNTDSPEDPLPSLPNLNDDFDFTLNIDSNEDGKNVKQINCLMKINFFPISAHNEVTSTAECSSVSKDSIDSQSNKRQPKSKFKPHKSPIVLDSNSDSNGPTYTTSSTNTEDSEPLLKKMVDQATSSEPIATCNKSTITVRSSTTRGTSTVNPEVRSFGVQFPEMSLERIFSETIFDLPDCLSPIEDESLVQTKEMVSMGTITDFCNVNREIDYMCKPKTETLSFEELLSSRNQEEESFIILGQTLFDMFLKRIRKSNESLSNDEITRKKIWKHLKRQLLDRFSELSFDETLNGSNSDLEAQDRMSQEEFECSKVKVGWEEFVVEPEIYGESESTFVTCEESKLQDSVLVCQESSINEPECSNTNIEESIPIQSEMVMEMVEPSTTAEETQDNEKAVDENDAEFEAIFETMNNFCSSLPECVAPLEELTNIMWNSVFPETTADAVNSDESPILSDNVLEGFDFDHEPIEIPTEADMEVEEILQDAPENQFSEFDTPKSPSFMTCSETAATTTIIPLEKFNASGKSKSNSESILSYNQQTRKSIIQWQQSTQILAKSEDKQLRKTRKAIKTYLDTDWTDESVDECLSAIKSREMKILLESIYETVEDNKHQKDICTNFSPPAPPLPLYQQKLILLIKKLSDEIPDLPHKLLEDFEEKLLKLENYNKELDDLRNLCYYYSALTDLFFEGNSTMVFYFIVKCIYFFGYKAIPMVFVLIKAFPQALPKKSLLLKKYSTTVDWENMTGLELSKVHFDTNCMDSLDLTVMYLLTCTASYNRKAHESHVIKNHELFSYLPKFYGFQLGFMTAPKLLDILMKRLVEGQLENLSLSFILLAKRANTEFAVRTLLKGNLLTSLEKFTSTLISTNDHSAQPLVSQICLLTEVVSSIAKTHNDEDKSMKSIFPILVSILGRVNNREIQESCMKAILRIQRLVDNHKEIYAIIKHHQSNTNSRISEGLCCAAATFVHRKNEKFFKDSA